MTVRTPRRLTEMSSRFISRPADAGKFHAGHENAAIIGFGGIKYGTAAHFAAALIKK